MPFLPLELLHIVYSYLPKKELSECMKVCRLWHSKASPKFYRELSWRNSQNKELLELIGKPLIDGKTIGDHATKLEFTFGYADLQRHEFETVIDNLPKLEVIRVVDIYIRYLYDIPAYKLTRLQELSFEDTGISRDMDLPDIHYLANKQLRNQITTLEFSILDSEEFIRDLSSFTRLQKLDVSNYSNPDDDDDEEHLITIVLDGCSNLTCLNVMGIRKWVMNRTSNVRHTNLKTLELSIPEIDAEHVECIMRSAPNLKKFCFSASEDFHKSMSSMEAASELLSYLQNLEYLKISACFTAEFRSYISYAHLWDFWKNLCGKKCSCDVDVTITRQIHGAYVEDFVKRNQHLKAKFSLGVDVTNDNRWADRMDFLTFKSIRFKNYIFDKKRTDYDSYLRLVRPVLRLLKHQQQECPLDIDYNSQVVYFDSVPIESKESFETTRKRLQLVYGNVRGVKLEDEMLSYLSSLYPFTQHLTLKDCLPVQENKKDNAYYLDLTQFNKFRMLDFDFDSVFSEQKMTVTRFYIRFIGMSGVSGYFYYDESKLLFELRYLGSNEIAIPSNTPIVNIRHAHITQFYFRRVGRFVPIIT